MRLESIVFRGRKLVDGVCLEHNLLEFNHIFDVLRRGYQAASLRRLSDAP